MALLLGAILDCADPDGLGDHAVGLHGRQGVGFGDPAGLEASVQLSIVLAPVPASDSDRRSSELVPLFGGGCLEDVLQHDAAIRGLVDVPVEGVKALAVPCAHEGAVDVHEIHAELAADLVFDWLGGAFVILVQEKVRLELFLGDQVVFE